MERIGKTLPGYISARREFDNMPIGKIRTVLIQRGKIEASASLKEVSAACIEAMRLVDLYLR